MKRKLLWLIYAIFFHSCNLPILFGDKELGAGYYYSEDGKLSTIIYSTKKPYKSSGLEVIPPQVVDFEYNNLYVIVKSIDNQTKNEYYWIIDKKVRINLDDCNDKNSCDSLLKINVIGPLDSIWFRKEIDKSEITLRF
jgi:hypothetical protein